MRFLRITFTALVLMVFPLTAQADCTAPAGVEGQIFYSNDHKTFQGCTGSVWVAFNKPTPDPCAGSPSPGDQCNDGSVYAGLSPDGNVPMYTTPADAGLFPWNNGVTVGYVDTSLTNCVDGTPGTASTCHTGKSNTAFLITKDADDDVSGFQPHRAAQHCADLTAHGYDDWYLPAQDELDVLHDNKVAIGGFNVSGTFPEGLYWSSSEQAGTRAQAQYFNDGAQRDSGWGKRFNSSVRCVRR